MDFEIAPNREQSENKQMARIRTAKRLGHKAQSGGASRRRSCKIEKLEPRIALAADTIVLPGVAPDYTVYVQGTEYLPIQTDPTDGRLVNTDVHDGTNQTIVLGEWNTNGQYEGWSVSNASSDQVVNGSLVATLATSTSSDLQFTRNNLTTKPDLDYGYNDYVQVRMKLPVGYDQDITFSYGTTTRNGFASTRELILPGDEIANDGQWHEYRMDVGLEVSWRDSLDDLQITIPDTGQTGQSVEIDYIEIGDQPGDVLLINTSLNKSPEVQNAGDETRVESKHFATWWSPTVENAKPNAAERFDPATDGLRSLRMMEESYQVYTKVLGYIEPFYGPNTPQPIAEGSAKLDYFGAMPINSVHDDFSVSVPFTSEGSNLTIVATLDGLKNGADARLYRNPVGVFPVAADHGSNPSGDGNVWAPNEELAFSYQILDGAVDVTADYEVYVTGATAEWTNTTLFRMGLEFGSDQLPLFGKITFQGNSNNFGVGLREPLAPIDITGASSGFEIDLNPAIDNDHFRLRDLRLQINPVGGSSGSGIAVPSPLPDYSIDRYKTNHTTWYGGFWMSAWQGYTYFNVGESGLRDEGWGNPVPHELGHAVQGAQPGFLVGGHWESHANYLRENWVNYFAANFPQNEQSHLSERVLINSQFHQDHKRFIYQDYRIHLALQDYATQLGLDPNIAAQLWQVGDNNQSVYEKLESLLPEGTTVADVMGETMRYWPVLDFVNGELVKENLWTTATEKAMYDYQVGSLLIPSADKPDWYRVPFERAPEKFAYMFHELIPTNSTVTVEFQGVDVIGNQEDWRWSLVAIDDDGNPRYSDSWSPGTHSFDLLPDEERVLLVVVATPDDTSLDLDSYYNVKAPDKHIDRLRYPYEVRIVGAEQASKQLDWNSTNGSFRTNPDGSPGGWVANSAFVSSTAYVGPNARVLGSARVENNARIEDYAVIAGSARIRDNAVVSGYAAVIDSARVEDNAYVIDRALVKSSANILGNAVVEDYAIITDNVTITGSATARGSSEAFSNESVISGTAIIDYDYSMAWTVDDGVHFNHIAWGAYPLEYHAETLRKARGLIASYRVEAPEGEVLWDEFGAEHALLRGEASRVIDYAATGQVISFNGSDQHVLLDRSVLNLRDGSFGMWIKPGSTKADQTLLYAGSDSDNFLELTAGNQLGLPVLTISVDGNQQEIVSNTVIQAGEWSHVAFTFGSGQMKLYVDGALAGQVATGHQPQDVLLAGDYLTAEHVYLGRSATGGHFAGRIDDARFYNVTRSDSEVAAEMDRRGAVLGAFYTDAPKVFDGTSTTDESGVPNGLERTLTALIKPASSANVSYYEAVFDSNDELFGRIGSGFGLDDGKFVVRLDGLGFWNTEVAVQLGVWQEVTVAFNGTEAYLYVDGEQMASRSYTAIPNALAGKNYRLGFGQADNDSLSYFHGEIRDAKIMDRMILPDAVLTGDYNDDGIVNLADYTVWRDTLGQTVVMGSGADGDNSGQIDQGDYTAWKQTFGAVAYSSSSLQTSMISSAASGDSLSADLHQHADVHESEFALSQALMSEPISRETRRSAVDSALAGLAPKQFLSRLTTREADHLASREVFSPEGRVDDLLLLARLAQARPGSADGTASVDALSASTSDEQSSETMSRDGLMRAVEDAFASFG